VGLPDVVVPLAVSGDVIGEIACGPRHGGWGETDIDLVRTLARHAALALNSAALAATLAEQVRQLESSRARLVVAEEEGRRRVERDLHDGVQQQLIVLLARLELLRTQVPVGSAAAELVGQTQDVARETLVDLRTLVDGIHPPVLTDRGLVAAVEARAALLPIRVGVDVSPPLEGARFTAEVEGAAYYVICESLTNVMKHSGSEQARVSIEGQPGVELRVAGSGLSGLRDRVEALGGSLEVRSSIDTGTTIVALLPCRETVDA
jgi:signal transduction histidine kinase